VLTDRHKTDMTNLMVAFLNFANTRKNTSFLEKTVTYLRTAVCTILAIKHKRFGKHHRSVDFCNGDGLCSL
jgi:hypothetical protein